MPISKQDAINLITSQEKAEYDRAIKAIDEAIKGYIKGQKLTVGAYAGTKVFQMIKETYEAIGWKVDRDSDYRESWITLE